MLKLKEKIVIFGASTRGKFVYEKLCDKYEISYFCDNDKKKQGGKFCGIEIISPEKLKSINYKIIVASMYYEQIAKQLKNMGISNFDIYPSAIECVLNKLRENDLNLEDMCVLEVFGGDGKATEMYYEDIVEELDVWELDGKMEEKLKNNLPKANIKIVDSFEEIKTTKKTYNMIVMDNPMQNYGEHSENFDMFLEIFRIIRDECVVILNIMPNIEDITSQYYFLRNPQYILCRKLFYRTLTPLNISIEEIIRTYEEIIQKNNYELEWYFTEERSENFIYYLVLKIRKCL